MMKHKWTRWFVMAMLIATLSPLSGSVKAQEPAQDCMTFDQLQKVVDEHIYLEVAFGSIPGWAGAHAGLPVSYYDLNGNVVAYMLPVVRTGEQVGYVVVYSSTCQVVEYAESKSTYEYNILQARHIAEQWKMDVDEQHPIYVSPFDQFFVLRPQSTDIQSYDDARVLLNMDDFSFYILDAANKPLFSMPSGQIPSQPEINPELFPRSSTEQSPQSVSATAAHKELTTPNYRQFPRDNCWVGCSPLAGGTLMGYWAERNFPNLINPDWKSTVRNLADRAGTKCGETDFNNLSGAMVGFSKEKGYSGFSSRVYKPSGSQPTFNVYKNEIDNNHPVVVNFAWSATGVYTYLNGHANTGIGYDTASGNYMIVKKNLNYDQPNQVSILHNGNGPYPGWLMYNTLVPPQDDTPPTKASNVRPDGWTGPYTSDTTPRFEWDAASDSDSGLAGYYVAVDDWTPDGSSGNDWWVGNVTAYTVPNPLPEGQHYFAVTSQNNVGNVNPTNTNQKGDAPYTTFYVDVASPSAPKLTVSGAGCAGIQNNGWQNMCRDPVFTWSAIDNGSGVKDYHYYWGTLSNGSPNIWTISTSFDPIAIASADGYASYYLNITARDYLTHESGLSTFGVLYDGAIPTVTLQINNGAENTNQTSVLLNLSTGDIGSGVAEICVSSSADSCSDWQPYANIIPWTLPALNRREHTVYVWVRDKAGNEASDSDTITLDLYPPMPHSANYRICADVIDAGGSVGVTSTNYSLVSAIGQPWATGAISSTSSAFNERSGFLSSITGCLPISHTITNNYTVTQWVIASGGSLRGSTNYRLGDTTGQPAASGTNSFTSTSYTLSSGFWAQVTGTVPPTTTIPPTPVPITPTATPTPGPTPTPQPGAFGVSINDGMLYTNDSSVMVRAWAPNVTQMMLSNDQSFAGAYWQTYRITVTWALSTSGSYVTPRLVYAQFKDSDDVIYGTYVGDITYDPVPPEGSVSIASAGTTTMTLWIEAYDDNSGMSGMRITDDLDEISTAVWQPFTTTVTGVLSNSVVYVQFQDRAGNESLIYDSTGEAHALNSRPTGVSIQGPTSGARDTDYFFVASVSPSTVTLPITYTWQVFPVGTGDVQSVVTHANTLNANDVTSFTWNAPGTKAITVTATNSLGSASGAYSIAISSLTASVTKTVAPTGQVDYGDALTYTLVISGTPGEQVGLYDPLEGTTFDHFVTHSPPITHSNSAITGTLTITPTQQVTVSFVVQVGIPGTAGWLTDVTNRACIYDPTEMPMICIWSDPVTNIAFRSYDIYLPLVLRDY
ncbi:MAG: hypothetical protein GY832_36170 [Chloroflexi bacterium]|nr:hypothetical protein [Chloroflexota bacterium]